MRRFLALLLLLPALAFAAPTYVGTTATPYATKKTLKGAPVGADLSYWWTSTDQNNVATYLGELRDQASWWVSAKSYGTPASAVSAATAGTLLLVPSSSSASSVWTNTLKVPTLDLRPLVTASFGKYDTIGTPALYLRRRNTSPPVNGAGVINPYYDPAFRFDWESDSGGVTGAHGGIFVYSGGLSGKQWTTTTQPITLSGSAQTVSVADSSLFATGDVLYLDPLDSEGPTVISVPDSTHVRAIFTKNHASGVWVAPGGKGDKIGIASLITEGAGNSSNITNLHSNTVVTQTGTHTANGWENDVTSSVDPGLYLGDGSPVIYGFTNLAFGPKDSTFGGQISTGDGVGSFRTGLILQGRDQGLWITNQINTSLAPTVGMRVSSAKTYGLVIGANQAKPHPVEQNVNPATAGILLTARDISGTVDSNKLRLEGLTSSVAHTWDLYAAVGASQLRFDYDGVFTGQALDTDGAFSTTNAFRVRDGTLVTRGTSFVAGGTSFSQFDIFQTNGNVAASGSIRLKSTDEINYRNNAGSGDLHAIQHDTNDRIYVGAGSAGVVLTAGTPIAGVFYGTKISWAAGTVGAAGQATTTVSIPGAVASGKAPVVMVTPIATLPAPLTVYGYVSGADTVTLVLVNASAGGVAAGTPSFNIAVFQN